MSKSVWAAVIAAVGGIVVASINCDSKKKDREYPPKIVCAENESRRCECAGSGSGIQTCRKQTWSECDCGWPVVAKKITVCPRKKSGVVILSLETIKVAEISVNIYQRGAAERFNYINSHYRPGDFQGDVGQCVDLTVDYKPRFDGNTDWVYGMVLEASSATKIGVRRPQDDNSAAVGRLSVKSGAVYNPQ